MKKEVLKAELKKELCFLGYKNLDLSVGEKSIFIFLDANARPKFNIFLGQLGEFGVWVCVEECERILFFEILQKMKDRILKVLSNQNKGVA